MALRGPVREQTQGRWAPEQVPIGTGDDNNPGTSERRMMSTRESILWSLQTVLWKLPKAG